MKTKKLTTVAMLCAVAYVAMLVGRVPLVWILKYDPKDVIIAIGGFIYGPMTAFIISVVVSLVEMVTVSETGIIGCIMNIISSCCLTCAAAFIYKKRHTIKGAAIGLFAGVILSTSAMLLWNYLMVPLYSDFARADVAKMLLPTFLPFNLLKGGINTAITLILYKPVVTALRKAGLVDSYAHRTSTANAADAASMPYQTSGVQHAPGRTGIILVALFLLVTCIFFALVIRGIA